MCGSVCVLWEGCVWVGECMGVGVWVSGGGYVGG